MKTNKKFPGQNRNPRKTTTTARTTKTTNSKNMTEYEASKT
jgi:hypothetical protein